MHLSIPKPPWTGLGKRLESAFRKALYDFEMLADASGVTVALSGGKDSLTLLFLLKAVLGKGFADLPIHAVHVNGEFTCGAGVNEDYLRSVCDALGVSFHVRCSTQKLDTLECYSCSRERRRLIFEAAREVNAPTVAFGHHSDDHTLTVLMNLLHKGEFAGNLPKLEMVDYGVTLIRPLIYISEQEIIEFAKQQGFLRALCRCPVGQRSMRKKTKDLLKDIEQLYPEARANIARAGLVYGSKKAARSL
jgi:tRNA(Ile)-lysidine synthase TilS/MesJ